MIYSMAGRTALVTGASQGIGAAVARRLAGQGARLVLAARSADKLEALADEIRANGGEALAFSLDVSDAEGVMARIKELPAAMAAIDILVNNAGITDDNLFGQIELACRVAGSAD